MHLSLIPGAAAAASEAVGVADCKRRGPAANPCKVTLVRRRPCSAPRQPGERRASGLYGARERCASDLYGGMGQGGRGL